MTLTPSTSHLWANCALSATFVRGSSAQAPAVEHGDTDASEQKREGQAADWLANTCLRDAIPVSTMIDATAPNGWKITPDMVRHIGTYIDYCRSLGTTVHVQVPVNIPSLHIRGRADAQIVKGSDDHSLHVVSLKYGWRVVEPEWNAQLLCEALALYDSGIHDSITMTVYQPRPAHPQGKARSWELNTEEVVDAYRWLAGKALAALDPNAMGTPGGAYCKDCPGAGSCSALTTASYAAFDWVRGSVMTQMDPVTISREKEWIDEAYDLIKARRNAVTAEVEGRMRRGEYIPGQAWDMQLKDREFFVEPVEIEAKTGVHPYKSVLMSPAELERAGADPAIVETITTRRSAGAKLKPHTKKAFAQLFRKAQPKK